MVHQVAIEELKYFPIARKQEPQQGQPARSKLRQNHTNDHHDTLLFNVLFSTPSIILLAYFRFKEKRYQKIDLFSICNLQGIFQTAETSGLCYRVF